MGARVCSAPSGSTRTAVAATASCPSRKTVALTGTGSPTTAFAAKRPPSTTGITASTGMRPTAVPGGLQPVPVPALGDASCGVAVTGSTGPSPAVAVGVCDAPSAAPSAPLTALPSAPPTLERAAPCGGSCSAGRPPVTDVVMNQPHHWTQEPAVSRERLPTLVGGPPEVPPALVGRVAGRERTGGRKGHGRRRSGARPRSPTIYGRPLKTACSPRNSTASRACADQGCRYPAASESDPSIHRAYRAPGADRGTGGAGQQPSLVVAPAHPGAVRIGRPPALGRQPARSAEAARRAVARGARRARRRRGLRRAGGGGRGGPARVPAVAALVPGTVGFRARRGAGEHRLLLPGVRDHRGAAAVLGRSGDPRR